MKAYIVKNTESNKYVSKTNFFEPTVGDKPILIFSREEAEDVLDKVVRKVDYSKIEQLELEEEKYLKAVYKAEKVVAEAKGDVEAAEELNRKYLIREANSNLKRTERALKRAKTQLSTTRAMTTKAKKVSSNFSIVELEV